MKSIKRDIWVKGRILRCFKHFSDRWTAACRFSWENCCIMLQKSLSLFCIITSLSPEEMCVRSSLRFEVRSPRVPWKLHATSTGNIPAWKSRFSSSAHLNLQGNSALEFSEPFALQKNAFPYELPSIFASIILINISSAFPFFFSTCKILCCMLMKQCKPFSSHFQWNLLFKHIAGWRRIFMKERFLLLRFMQSANGF